MQHTKQTSFEVWEVSILPDLPGTCTQKLHQLKDIPIGDCYSNNAYNNDIDDINLQ